MDAVIAVVTFIAAMVIFLAGLVAIASGWRNQVRSRPARPVPDEESELMVEIEEWLRQQQ